MIVALKSEAVPLGLASVNVATGPLNCVPATAVKLTGLAVSGASATLMSNGVVRRAAVAVGPADHAVVDALLRHMCGWRSRGRVMLTLAREVGVPSPQLIVADVASASIWPSDRGELQALDWLEQLVGADVAARALRAAMSRWSVPEQPGAPGRDRVDRRTRGLQCERLGVAPVEREAAGQESGIGALWSPVELEAAVGRGLDVVAERSVMHGPGRRRPAPQLDAVCAPVCGLVDGVRRDDRVLDRDRALAGQQPATVHPARAAVVVGDRRVRDRRRVVGCRSRALGAPGAPAEIPPPSGGVVVGDRRVVACQCAGADRVVAVVLDPARVRRPPFGVQADVLPDQRMRDGQCAAIVRDPAPRARVVSPSSIRSSLRVRVPWLRMSPPKFAVGRVRLAEAQCSAPRSSHSASAFNFGFRDVEDARGGRRRLLIDCVVWAPAPAMFRLCVDRQLTVGERGNRRRGQRSCPPGWGRVRAFSSLISCRSEHLPAARRTAAPAGRAVPPPCKSPPGPARQTRPASTSMQQRSNTA